MFTHLKLAAPLDENVQKELLGMGISSEIPEGNKRRIIEHNLRLVLFIANKYHAPNLEDDDLFQIGTVGLIKATDSFNPCKKTKFATYATTCIENEIRMYLRKTNKYKNDISLQSPLSNASPSDDIMVEETIEDVTVCFEEDVLNKVVSSDLLSVLNKLDERLKIVVMTRIIPLNGVKVKQKNLAKKLKVEQSYVSRLEKKAIQMLEPYLLPYR